MTKIREAQKVKNKDYDATACLQLQVMQICRLAGADCHPSIGESLINNLLCNVMPVYCEIGGGELPLKQQPKFSEVEPLVMLRG